MIVGMRPQGLRTIPHLEDLANGRARHLVGVFFVVLMVRVIVLCFGDSFSNVVPLEVVPALSALFVDFLLPAILISALFVRNAVVIFPPSVGLLLRHSPVNWVRQDISKTHARTTRSFHKWQQTAALRSPHSGVDFLDLANLRT